MFAHLTHSVGRRGLLSITLTTVLPPPPPPTTPTPGRTHSYTIVVGYTFGESDSYRTVDMFTDLRLWILKRFKVPVFACWGIWWCPLLPRGHVAMETVVGNPMVLPKIAEPTQAEIDHWHGLYIEKLVDLFERNKAKFGYADRELELY